MKKILCTLISLILIILSFSSFGELSQPSTSALGDVDSSGSINGKDVLALRKYIVGLETDMTLENADVNYDGNINGKDVLMLRKYIVGLIDSFELQITLLNVADVYEFEEFLASPDISTLNYCSSEIIKYAGGNVLSVEYDINGEIITSDYETFYRNQFLVVYPSLIKYMNNTNAILDTLKASEAGFNDDIEIYSAYLIGVYTHPNMIYLDTDQGAVFITADLDSENQYTYTAYAHQDYLDNYSAKPAQLIIDGNVTNADVSNASVYKNISEIPLLYVIKGLGGDVVVSDTTASITFNSRDFIFDFESVTLTEVGTENDLLLLAPGDTMFYRQIENDVVISTNVVRSFFDEFDITISHNYSTAKIEVTKS